MSELENKLRECIYEITARTIEGEITKDTAISAIADIMDSADHLGYTLFENENATIDDIAKEINPHSVYYTINTKPFSRFQLSVEAMDRLAEMNYDVQEDPYGKVIDRDDPRLTLLMHELGPERVSCENRLKLIPVPSYRNVRVINILEGYEVLIDANLIITG